MFDHLVDLTEPICQKLNPHNLDDSYDPYKAAYGSMPTHAAANPAIQQMYINGYFCYAYKFGIVTNGLGIVRDISFYNKDFLTAHPDIIVEKKSDSPDEDKSLADSKALLPVLIDFFQKHPLIEPKTFLGDAAFDTIEIYKSLFEDIGFRKAFIPLRVKLSMEGTDYTVNENGIPCCPHDSSLPMKREGSKSHLRSKLPTMKQDPCKCRKINQPFQGLLVFIAFSSQSIWEVFLSCLILISPASHLRNPALQDSYRIFNQDCELVSQLPIVYLKYFIFS